MLMVPKAWPLFALVGEADEVLPPKTFKLLD